jgi:hypothetical protein
LSMRTEVMVYFQSCRGIPRLKTGAETYALIL